MNPELGGRIALFFMKISELESLAEKDRQVLAREKDFEPYAIYLKLDKYRAGSLCSLDVHNFLVKREAEMSESDAQLLVQMHSSAHNNKLSYTDFLRLVLPQEDPQLRARCTQRPTYAFKDEEECPENIEHFLAQLMTREIQLQKEVSARVRQIVESPDFDFTQLLEALEHRASENITQHHLRTFLKKFNLFPYDHEALQILRRLDLGKTGVTLTLFHHYSL